MAALTSVAIADSPSARQDFLKRLSTAAIERTHHSVRYAPAHAKIPYPGGVPAATGVCTDEVIRAYRTLGVDLQKEVHEDMVSNFSAYPRKWSWLATRPDTNIDHRRVPNLQVFFARKGETLRITRRSEDYLPGELVTWDLGGNVPHIGIVVDTKGATGRYMLVHNIGQGPRWKMSCSIGKSRPLPLLRSTNMRRRDTSWFEVSECGHSLIQQNRPPVMGRHSRVTTQVSVSTVASMRRIPRARVFCISVARNRLSRPHGPPRRRARFRDIGPPRAPVKPAYYTLFDDAAIYKANQGGLRRSRSRCPASGGQSLRSVLGRLRRG